MTVCESVPDTHRTPLAASINRITLVDLPSIVVDEGVLGQQAYHLLSVPALICCALEHAGALKLPQALRDVDPQAPRARQALPRWVNGALSSSDAAARSAAQGIAARLGRNLGYLLTALHRGDAVNRAARHDWTEQEWSHWHAVRQVWLGGGVLSGVLGNLLVDHARAVLTETGCDGVRLERTRHPGHMATLGAGRCLPRPPGALPDRRALALDLGQTSIKAAVLTYQNHVLENVAVLAPCPVPWRWRNSPDAGRAIDPHAVLDYIVNTICVSLTEATGDGLPIDPQVAMSVAAYVDGGRLLGNGLYARMSVLGDDVRPLIADATRSACGWRPELTVIHDGTAAAAVHAGEAPDGAPSAAIVVGTALGVGFPAASAEGLYRLAPDLVIEDPAGTSLS